MYIGQIFLEKSSSQTSFRAIIHPICTIKLALTGSYMIERTWAMVVSLELDDMLIIVNTPVWIPTGLYLIGY